MNLIQEKQRLLERYRQLRALSRDLHTELMQSLSTDVFTECAKTLGFLVNDTLVFENEDESAVLMDYCLYDGWSGEHNAVTQYLAQQPHSADSDETLLLEAMSRARYSLYQMESIVEGLGVNARDALHGDSLLLIDEALSRTAVEGIVVAARILTLPDFAMTTGATLPIDAETLDDIMRMLPRTRLGFDDAASEPLSRQEAAALSSVIIRCALERGASSRMSYEGPPQRPSRERHVSRNDPCPCGSGRKFKKCCGRS